MSIIYYITGHGYGHARRAAHIIRALSHRHPELPIHVRTSAPGWIFDNISPAVFYHNVTIDRGAVEDDPLNLNWPATLKNVADFLPLQPRLIADELAFIRQHHGRLIVADIPFVAGYIADAAGIPGIGVGNFTWDWIYEPYLLNNPRYPDLLRHIRRGYEKIQCLLRLPFPQPVNPFPKAIDVPFIADPNRRDPNQTLQLLAISPQDHRPRVLIAMRGGISAQTLHTAARSAGEFLFLTPAPLAPGLPENVRPVTLNTHSLGFWDVLSVCHAAVSKLGHGIITDCAASRAALLYPQRTGFREDPLLASGAPSYFRIRQIETSDFAAGHWNDSLQQLLKSPQPTPRPRLDGTQTCADLITHWL